MPISTLGPNALASSSVTRPKIGYAGAVLQAVQGTATTQVTVNTNTYTDIGLSATVTPSSSSSKILIIATAHCYAFANGNGYGLRLLKDSTVVWDPSPQDGSGPFYCYSGAGGGVWDNSNIQFLDSPATTSTITYKIQGRPYLSLLGSAIFNYAGSGMQGKSSLILLEIAG